MFLGLFVFLAVGWLTGSWIVGLVLGLIVWWFSN